MTEQGGVNIRARHTAPEVCGPAAPRPPRLLSSCHLIKAKSLPIPAGIPHQTARGAFYPKQNAAACHSGGSATSRTRMAKFNTAEWKSIPGWGGVAQTREGGGGKRWKGHQENGILKDTACLGTERSQMMPGRQLMSRLDPVPRCLTIKAKHLFFSFFPLFHQLL